MFGFALLIICKFHLSSDIITFACFRARTPYNKEVGLEKFHGPTNAESLDLAPANGEYPLQRHCAVAAFVLLTSSLVIDPHLLMVLMANERGRD